MLQKNNKAWTVRTMNWLTEATFFDAYSDSSAKEFI